MLYKMNLSHMDRLDILLVGEECFENLFKDAFGDLKMDHSITCYDNPELLENYLSQMTKLPDIIFFSLEGGIRLDIIKYIRQDRKYAEIIMGVYGERIPAKIREKAFMLGINICVAKKADIFQFRKSLQKIIALSFQYISDGLGKQNFIMNC